MGKVLNRRQLREQADEAELADEADLADDGDAAEPAAVKVRPRKKKAAAAPKARKPRAKKAPPRMRARWGVFDNAMKQVAVFDYNQRPAAEDRLNELLATKKGIHFMQIVKEPMPDLPVEAVLVVS